MPPGDYQSLSERARSLSPLLPPEAAELLAELAERVEQATAAEAVIRRARFGAAPAGPPRLVGGHRRDRHGLHAVQGSAAAALMWSAARAHKVLATAGVLALGTAVAVAPSVTARQPATAGLRPRPVVTARRLPGDPPAVPITAGERHRRVVVDIDRRRPDAVTPTPSPTIPIPLPTVSPTPTPSPVPSPTGTPPAGP